MISWYGAQAYADYYGYRLPTDNEWERAARGTDQRAYPWGNEIEKGNANYLSSRHSIEKSIENYARTTPVGFFNGKKYGEFETIKSVSPFGLYDMVGNVWQWVGNDYPYVHLKYMRGGSYQNYHYNLTVWARNSSCSDYYSIWTGFRCVRNPKIEEPIVVTDSVITESTEAVVE